jgi:FkbM family methyltransferase
MRKFIRKILNSAGYDIIKVNEHSNKKAGKVVKVKVGNYTIDMPGNNSQISMYKYQPDANSLLGTLAACVVEKYPDMTVIDVGANVGDTLAVIKTAIDVPVIGIEGDPVSYRFLEQNARQFNNVIVLKEFLGEEKQTIKVAFEKSGWNTTLIPTASAGESILLKTLDEVLEENNLSEKNSKLFKVDCEGFDTIIIRGAGTLLEKKKPVIFFEYNKTNMNAIGEDGLSTLFALEKFGYSNIIFFDNYGRYILNTPLSQRSLIKQLHHYTEDGVSQVGFFDLCLFHDRDQDIAQKFIEQVAGYKP